MARTSWNKGLTKETDSRVAQYAKSLRGQPSKLRSRPRSPEVCAAISKGLTGKTLSPEHKATISRAKKGCRGSRLGKKNSLEHNRRISMARRGRSYPHELGCGCPFHQDHKEDCTCTRCSDQPPGSRRLTNLALDLATVLLQVGYDLIPEVKFGRYRVDFYEPTRHLAFEADGDYWHEQTERTRPGYYARRDAYLLERFDLPVAHFTEMMIKGLTT